ncbi:MAG: hypothetical protein ACOZBW_13510 [Thermodesulfobacteriota bacterium]
MNKTFEPAFFLAIITAILFFPGALLADVHVVGGLSRHMVLAPGAEAQGRVLVRNAGDKAQTAKVYLTGYQATADGKTVYGDPKKAARSNAAWIHLVPQQQEIPAGATASFHYVIRVPDNPDLAGTYWSMLMVEPVAPETLVPPAPEKGKLHFGVRTVTRTGIHMVTHMGDTGTRDLKFTGRTLEKQEGSPVLQLDFENTGQRYLKLTLWAELFDSQGFSIGRFDAGQKGLYPADSARMKVNLTDVPPGPYQVLVVADNGDEHVFGARYEMDIPK